MSNTRVHNKEVFASRAFTVAAGAQTKRISNFSGKGCVVHVNVGTHGGGTINVKLQSVDPISGNAVDIAGAAIAPIVAANAYVALYFFPGVAVVANVKVDGVLPANFNVVVTPSVADVTACSVSVDIIP